MYAVQYVGDEELPKTHSWVLVREGGCVHLFIKESAVCPRVLEEAWAGFRALEPRAVPKQRRPSGALALRG